MKLLNKLCTHCTKEYKAGSNSSKYCSQSCNNLHTHARRKERWTYHNTKKYSQLASGKRQCPFCSGYYYKLASHTVQRHEINARELKQRLGLPYGKGLITSEHKELLKEHAYENYDKVIKHNLIIKGELTRFKHEKNRML